MSLAILRSVYRSVERTEILGPLFLRPDPWMVDFRRGVSAIMLLAMCPSATRVLVRVITESRESIAGVLHKCILS